MAKVIKKKVKSLTEKVEEMYTWYEGIKFFSRIWEIITAQVLLAVVLLLLFILGGFVVRNVVVGWTQTSIDTKFTVGFGLLTFVLGIIVGKIKR